MNGLRLLLNPTAGPAPVVQIDWIRLFRQGQSGAVPGATPGAALFYQGTYDPPRAGAEGTAGCGELAGGDKTDLSALPGGVYQFFTDPGCTVPLTDLVTIVPRPTPIATAPSLAGGRDYATSYLKNPWDFSGVGDVVRTGNMCGNSYRRTPGAYSAYNCRRPFTGYINDPFFELRVGKGRFAIPTRVFHRLTVTFTYGGRFSLNGGCHGGTIGRLMWLDTRHPNGPVRQTQDFVTYKDRSEFTIDLAQSPAVLNDGPASTRTRFVVPKGQYVTYLRWDPNEDTCARWFQLHDVKLRADDAPSAGMFNIAWKDPTARAGDQVSIYVLRSGATAFTQIVSGLSNSATGTSYPWATSGLLPGKYRVYVQVSRAGAVGDFLATGPVSL
jgi:hypothetical protein